MTEDFWNKKKRIFAEAVAAPTINRAALLDKKCGEDLTLRAELDQLLDAYFANEDFIEQPIFQVADLTDNLDYAGTQFGNYRIIKEIGRGGMGAVFLAGRNDGAFDQQVALKIVRHSLADNELGKRFKLERQILASLNHPNIARLFDGGVGANGEPFLAMEFVEGEPINKFCHARNLSIEERLKIFLKVCRAVSFAHQNLIVHRDIKPPNILVTENGEPKLLDFGLAKITAADLDMTQTATVFRAFTPAYASPEQMHGKNITTASDVYSLGVVLYELLTGEKPFHFEGRSFEEILQTVDFTEPPRPSSIENAESNNARNLKSKIQNPKLLRGDLDNITLKALRKEPERRYKSVEAFADDIERHLKGLPIAARPNTIGYRAAKFFRRNRIAVSAAAFVVLALIAGLAAALWQAGIARAQRDRAEKRFADVRKLSNSLLFELSPRIERLQGSTETREILVARALEYLDSLAAESQTDAQLQSELASAYEKIGDLQGNPRKPNLSDFSGAKTSFAKARTIRQKLLDANPFDFTNRKLLAANFKELAKIEYWTGNPTESETASNEALAIDEKMLAEYPDSLELKLALADASFERADYLYINNRLTESYPYLQKSLALLEDAAARNPHNIEAQTLLARGYRQFGLSLSWDEKQAAGEAEMAKALKISERLATDNPNDLLLKQELAKTYANASSIYEEVNNALALELVEKALKISREVAEKDSADSQARQNLAQNYLRVGTIYNQLKNSAASESNLRKSLAILEELDRLEPTNPTYKTDIGTVYTHLGAAQSERKDFAGAIAEYEKAAAIYQDILHQTSSGKGELRHLALIYTYIGEAFEKKAEPDAARRNFQTALEFYNRLEAQNALTEYDRKYFERLKKTIKKFQKP